MRQTDVRQKHLLMSPPYGGEGIINGKGELRGQSVNSGSPGKMAFKTVYVQNIFLTGICKHRILICYANL